MVYLHVTFTVEAHNTATFESFYEETFWPVIREHGFEPVGIYRTLVGIAGEITEIWRFENLADYETKWKSLMGDPRLQDIFETTGPMVKQESFKLMEMLPFIAKNIKHPA